MTSHKCVGGGPACGRLVHQVAVELGCRPSGSAGSCCWHGGAVHCLASCSRPSPRNQLSCMFGRLAAWWPLELPGTMAVSGRLHGGGDTCHCMQWQIRSGILQTSGSGLSQGRVRAESGPSQGRVRASQGRVRAESGPSQGRVRAESGPSQSCKKCDPNRLSQGYQGCR
jgi:hypothetical protein